MTTYYQELEHKITLELRSMLKNMPYYCTDFLRGISNSTESRTQLAYCRDIYHFLQFVHDHNPEYKNKSVRELDFELLEKLTASDIDEYLEYLSYYEIDNKAYQNGNAAKARKLSSLSKFYTFFVKRGLLQNNPITAIERPKINEKAIISLNQNQIYELIEKTLEPTDLTERQMKFHAMTKIRDRAILMTLLGTGMRVSELVGLDLTDVDFKEQTLRVVRKGGKEAFVYFGEDVYDALQEYLLADVDGDLPSSSPRSRFLKPEKETNALFLSLRGSRITVRSVEILTKKYSSMLATNKTITPHKLRSTFGTDVYNNTVDIYLTAKSLGHKDINVTSKHYASMDEDKLREAADIFSGKNKE